MCVFWLMYNSISSRLIFIPSFSSQLMVFSIYFYIFTIELVFHLIANQIIDFFHTFMHAVRNTKLYTHN